ncbi:ABC transporter ATP-binding protein [Bacillus cereus]
MTQNGKSYSLRKTISSIYRFIRPYKRGVITALVATIVAALCDLAGIYLIKKMIDNGLAGETNQLAIVVIQILVMIVAGFAANYYITYATGWVGTKAVGDMRNALAKHLTELPVSQVESEHSGDLVSRITNDVSAIESFITQRFTNLIYAPIIVVCTLIYLGSLNWKLTLVSFAATPIMMYLANMVSKPIDKQSSSYYGALAEANSVAQEAISGNTITKAFNLEKTTYTKVEGFYNKAMNFGFKIAKQESLMRPFVVMMYELPVVLCTIYGGYLAVNGMLGAGALVAFLQMLRMLVNQTIQLPDLVANTRSAAGAVERINKMLDTPTERTDGCIFNPVEKELVLVEDVTFGYERDKNVISGINFTLDKGKIVALVGASGSGKSTILNLLLSFHEPQQGNIRVHGQNIKDWNLKSLREQFAVVSQDTFLFPGTIEENIRFGNIYADEKQIMEAAKIAGAEAFIRDFPEGFQTQVGERGAVLSGGQKQRISIARAVLKQAPILLLDEATSALDNESESEVQQALKVFSKDHTMLVIAHRLSTIKMADEILLLEQGRIVERGTHQELMEQDGLYSKYYLRQTDESLSDKEDLYHV